VVGGFDDSRGVVDFLQVYDPELDEWSMAAPLPRAVHHANVAALDGKLYVVGAMILQGFNFVAIGDVWEYDPGIDQWTTRESMPAGTERGSAAVAVVDGRI
jgi:N-acetylneuraminic acid mutarotase